MPRIYEDLKKDIETEARKLIVQKGYRSLNMREVAGACGIAVGTIYNYFPTKDALLSEIMYGYWKDFISRIKQVQTEPANLFEKLQKIYDLLEETTDIFKDTWIRTSGKNNGMTKEHYKQKNEIVKQFTDVVEAVIADHYRNQPNSSDSEISKRELASLIVQNFMMIVQMKETSYQTFEKILRSYFLKVN